MNTEAILNYVTLHSQAMIQWTLLAIVALVGVLIAHSLLSKREVGTTGAVGPDLTEHLNKLIAQTAQNPHSHATAADAGTAAPAHGHDGDLSALRAELGLREAEIARLKEAGAGTNAAAGAAAPVVENELAQRLKQLEAKLAEYEILEDDIADLSLYKDENTRLKNELEALKSAPSTAAAAEPAAPSALEDLDEPASTQPARTAEAAAEAARAAAAFDEPAAAPKAAPVPNVPAEGADDLFAEFATALEDNVDAAADKATGES